MVELLNVCSPAPRDVWRRLYEADPDALVTQSPAWIDCICAHGGYQDRSVYFENGKGQQVVVPMVRRRWTPGRLAVDSSLPRHWENGGPIGIGARDPAMLEAILAHFAETPQLLLNIRPNAIHVDAWRDLHADDYVKVHHAEQSIDLSGGFEEVQRSRFRSSVRRGVKKAEKSGIEVEHAADPSLIPVFYDLYMKSVLRWAKQQKEPEITARFRARMRDPQEKLDAIARRMTPYCHTWVARYQGEPAAAIVVLLDRNAQYIKGAMDKEVAGRTGANFLLHYKAIEEACRAGCGYYHMGLAQAGSPLAHFKGHFGAEFIDYDEYRFERLPVTRMDEWLRRSAKKLLGFKKVQ